MFRAHLCRYVGFVAVCGDVWGCVGVRSVWGVWVVWGLWGVWVVWVV
jgi:hypothetical protein